MLGRALGSDEQLVATWSDLGAGAPTIAALAQLCSRAWVNGSSAAEDLWPEARAILYVAGRRGVLEIKGTNAAYESPSRLLTVFVELDDETRIRFRDARNVQQNVRFLEGFRQLCARGLVMHHLYHEFTLTPSGFALAATISPSEVQTLLDFGQPCVSS
jgi:hypothetical protein